MSNFKTQCRKRQSRVRSDFLKVKSGDSDTILTYEDGFLNGWNFYKVQDFDIFSSVKVPFRKPLYCNLLRSEHIPYNFFIPLDWDKEFGMKVLNEILGNIIDKVLKVKIEHPPKPRKRYLNDNTSFDTYIEYRHKDGSYGILGIEVKYTEKSYPYSGSTEKERMENTDSIYYQVSKESGVFNDRDLTDLTKHDYRQIWRNHLLGERILIVDKPQYGHFHSLTFYPEGNTHFEEVIPKYKEYLKPEYQDRVQGVTYERFFQICRKHLPNQEYEKWVEWLERRYLIINP